MQTDSQQKLNVFKYAEWQNWLAKDYVHKLTLPQDLQRKYKMYTAKMTQWDCGSQI